MEIGPIRNIGQVYGQNGVINNNRSINPDRAAEIDEQQNVSPEIQDGTKVIGTSADGDVAKASEEALEGLKDGIVLPRNPETTAIADEKAEDEETQEISGSLTGLTSAELSRLQSTGEITKNEYDREIERREDIRSSVDSTDESVEAIAIRDGVNPAVTGQDNDITVANSAGTSAVDSQKNVGAIENDDDKEAEDKAAEARKEIISEQIENNNEFAKRMNNLASEEENITLQVTGMQQAVANGREDIVSQIFEEGLIKNINQI